MRADPKPAKRYRASHKEWEAIREHFAGQKCWCCQYLPWRELHHIYKRSQGGDDVIENLAPVCHFCHARIEVRMTFELARLRHALKPENWGYLRKKCGSFDKTAAWLERNYPVREAA